MPASAAPPSANSGPPSPSRHSRAVWASRGHNSHDHTRRRPPTLAHCRATRPAPSARAAAQIATTTTTTASPARPRAHSRARQPRSQARPTSSGRNSAAWYFVARASPRHRPTQPGRARPGRANTSTNAAVSQKVSSGSLKAVALNCTVSGATATTAAATHAAVRPPPSRRASCAVSGMSSSDASSDGSRAAHSTGPNRG